MLTLILLLQISPPSLTPSDADLEVEVLEPLKSAIEYQLEEGNVEYGTVPEGWPTEPEAWPTDDDEWAMQRERMH